MLRRQLTAALTALLTVVAISGTATPARAAGGQIVGYAATGSMQRDARIRVIVDVTYLGSGGPGPVLALPLRDDVDGDPGRQRLLEITDLMLRSSSGAPDDTQVERSDAQLTIRVAPRGQVTGTQHYVLDYTLAGTLAATGAGGDVVRWPVIAPDHPDDVRGVTATLRGPERLGSLICRAGDSECTRSTDQDGRLAEFEQTNLPARAGMRVGVTFAAGAFAVAPGPVVSRATPVGWVAAGLGAVALLAVLAYLVRRPRRFPSTRQAGAAHDQATP